MAPTEDPLAGLTIIPRRSRFRWVPVAIVLLFVLMLIESVLLNPRFEWPLVASYLFAPPILRGLATTLWLTALCMALGIVLGIVIAVCRLSDIWIVSTFARLYIWFFRGTPILVQLIFWYNLAALFPDLGVGIPFTDITFFRINTNDIVTPVTAAILGLALNEGAYMAEIVRAGISSVDHGQSDAGRALGMTRLKAMRRIILPQAMRVIIPPTGNETIGMLKMTSLVSVIALSDLLYSAQSIYSRTFETIPLLIVVAFWYLFVVTLLSIGQHYIEQYYGRSDQQQSGAARGILRRAFKLGRTAQPA